MMFCYILQTSLFFNKFIFLLKLAGKVFGTKLFSFSVFVFYYVIVRLKHLVIVLFRFCYIFRNNEFCVNIACSSNLSIHSLGVYCNHNKSCVS